MWYIQILFSGENENILWERMENFFKFSFYNLLSFVLKEQYDDLDASFQ